MNQEKIGKFISELRKEKNMTQEQLAEKLRVTNKSISRWENGKTMPDLALLKPLSNELGITVNELLSGERIEKEEYQTKSEENILNAIDYSNKKINKIIGIVTLIFGILILITSFAIFKSESGSSSFGAIIGIIFLIIGLGKILCKMKSKIKFITLIIVVIFTGIFLIIIDYLNVKLNDEAPRFTKKIVTIDETILYDTFFYDVYRCNRDTKNEYFKIEKNKKYTIDTIMNYCK